MKRRPRYRLNFGLTLGFILVGLVIVLWILSYFCMPHDPTSMDMSATFLRAGEDPNYLLGTDNFGRDILSRIMYGSRNVLKVGVASVALGCVIGSIIGAVSAIWKGPLAAILMRAIDGLMAFPGILLSLMMVTLVGKGSRGAIVAIMVFMIAPFARLVYSMILDNENRLFIKAAKSHGISNIRLLFSHYLPLLLPRLITQFSSSIGAAIMIETSLSFLGQGIQPPNASWGLMLNEARQFFLQYPYLAVAPGIAIAITVLGFNLLGDGLNDYLITRRSHQ